MNLRSKNHEVQYCRIRSAIIASTMAAEEEDVGGGRCVREEKAFLILIKQGLLLLCFARPPDTSDEYGISTSLERSQIHRAAIAQLVRASGC
jgi:hypothetical protein